MSISQFAKEAAVFSLLGVVPTRRLPTRLKVSQGSSRIRRMATPTVMAVRPTFTATTAQPAGFTRVPPTDSRVRFSGSGTLVDLGTAGRNYPKGATRVDGSFGAWDGAQAYYTDWTGRYISFRWNIPSGGSNKFRLWVNESPHAAGMELITGEVSPGVPVVSGLTVGTNNWIMCDLGSAMKRNIMLELSSTAAQPADFGGFGFNLLTDAVTTPAIGEMALMWIGDSYPSGQGATSPGESFVHKLARRLGFAKVILNTSRPSTGLLKSDTSVTPNYGPYGSRVAADVVPYAGITLVAVVQLSVNDGTFTGQTPSAIAAALAAYMAQIRAALPDAVIVVCLPLFVGTETTAQGLIRQEAMQFLASAGYPVIDRISASVNPFTGTGSRQSPNLSGNSDVFGSNSGDGNHPYDSAADIYAELFAGFIGPLIGQSV